MSINPDIVRSLFIDGLVNAHAVENKALSIIKPQVSKIENYPEVAAKLRLHIDETHYQIERLETVLDRLGTSASHLKDTALSLSGAWQQ